MDDELFEDLRAWRLGKAQEQKVPAFVVFTDATLVAIAETVPEDLATLAAVPGVGRAKLERYGSDVLDLCSTVAKKRVNK
jgi:DNA helicase-2/ATP-dependent DNA helicase PcrA